jgi:hypothetical protein
MSKSHARELSTVFRGLFRDASSRYPTLRTEFERDLTRLEALVEQRGLHVYMVDLPAVGKHLDRCLSSGQYILSGLPLTKRFSGRVVIPKFLRGLYLLVFHESGLLREDYDVEAIFFLRQILYVAKKAVYPCSVASIRTEVREFYDTDCSLPEPEGFWSATTPSELAAPHPYEGFHRSALLKARTEVFDRREAAELSIFLRVLDQVSNILTTTLGVYDPAEWRFRHGPGAIAERVGPSNKYYWTNWSHVLEDEYPIADYGFHSYSSWADRCGSNREIASEEAYSRLVAVPKTYSGPRLIAAEPSEHQWVQQNCWDYFSSRTRRSWIGRFVVFNDQSTNQSLCTKASKTGSLATIDLSSASDRVTCHVVGQLFRSNPKLLRALRASRTRGVVQTLAPNVPERIRLKKFSTMGSANTFPVESLLFLSFALAAVLTKRGCRRVSQRGLETIVGEVAVFGDDIVIPVDSRELFVRALEVLYFKVNDRKSFWTGRFRESCGVDAFDGVNVTPVYWRQPYDGGPESLASTVSCRNNFYQKFLLNTASELASKLPKEIPEVAIDSGVFGLKTRCRLRNERLLKRWNRPLQRVEVRTVSLISSQKRTATNDDTAILQYFTEAPDPTKMWVHGVPQRPTLRVKRRWVPEDVLRPAQA